MSTLRSIVGALVSFTSLWSRISADNGMDDISLVFDSLWPVFNVGDSSSPEFYKAIHQKFVQESPKEEDIKIIIDLIINGKKISYLSDNHFNPHGNLTGTVKHSNGRNMDVSSNIFGKSTGGADKGVYSSIVLNLNKFNFNGINAAAGILFHSRMGFSIDGNVVNWQGITKGSSFIVGPNETTVIMNTYGGITKGFTERLNNNKVEMTVSALGAYNSSNRFTKNNSTYLGQIELKKPAFQSIKQDIFYLPIGTNGTLMLNSSFLNDGSVESLGEGNIFRDDSIIAINMDLTGKSQFDVDNPYSRGSLQHFFNLEFWGKGLFVP